MTRDADNDNPLVVPRHDAEPQQSWDSLSDGNAALADQPIAHLTERLSHAAVDDTEALGIAGLEQSDQLSQHALSSLEPVTQSGALVPAVAIPSSNAIPINVLGLSMPHRPIPAARSTALQQRPPQAREQRRTRSADFGKQGNEHLFNRPPKTAEAQAQSSPMEQAINAKPRKPLTAQPGFVAGLVAALVCGGAFYGYLVL